MEIPPYEFFAITDYHEEEPDVLDLRTEEWVMSQPDGVVIRGAKHTRARPHRAGARLTFLGPLAPPLEGP